MAEETDPPRKFYGLKPKEFERVNDGRAAEQMAMPAVDPVDQRAIPDAPVDVRELARIASLNVPALKGNNPANRDNEVHTILRENLAQANAAGLNDLKPKKRRRSKRLRDYLILMIGVNGAIIAVVWSRGPAVATTVIGLAGVVMFSIILTWLMWAVWDNY